MIHLTPELAEICGIHAGDGYLRGKDHRKELDISGNIEEKEYYDKHVKGLFKKVFMIDVECKFFKYRNTYGFVIRDKEIIEFMHKLGFPYGEKSTTIKIPDIIMKSDNEEMFQSFLRGVFDTDGCVHFWKRNKGNYGEFKKTHHYYPIISFSTVSRDLNEEILILLKKTGFKKMSHYIAKPNKTNENIKYIIRLYGKKNLIHFFEKIGSKNPVKLSRFLVWRKFGFCPAHTTLKERLEMLKKPSNHLKEGPMM